MKLTGFLQTIQYKMDCELKNIQRKKALSKKRNEILSYYKKQSPENKELEEAANYLKNSLLNTFCAPFRDNYKWENIEVLIDSSNGLRYVMHQGKKLYFVRAFNDRTVKYCYNGLRTEQDPDSPHCYLSDNFEMKKDDVLLDVGSAEGIFALTHIEKLKHVVLFERDPQWVEALEATFAPWKDKVTIIRKYVSDCDDAENITIDSFLSDKSYAPTFIKIDVEGAEKRVLNGMQKTIQLPCLRLALCTYHQQEDFKDFAHFLSERGFKWSASKGVMLFLNDLESVKAPYFRKGLIRAHK
ncbi:FkbM family methyltransferase [uncultured Bacteroides sp.]|uniref:FkbM family methyltransferase n=1 Tax=uncultured Bacteroides sp. TaxID=162156 RepID=UPI002AAC0C1C|nr:FkbM family methyltransferase [uncultured Bacteroides sp.]